MSDGAPDSDHRMDMAVAWYASQDDDEQSRGCCGPAVLLILLGASILCSGLLRRDRSGTRP